MRKLERLELFLERSFPERRFAVLKYALLLASYDSNILQKEILAQKIAFVQRLIDI